MAIPRKYLVPVIMLLAGLVAFSGCANPSVAVSSHIDDLDLTGVWHQVVDVIDVQEETARLDTFNLLTDADGDIQKLSLKFYGYDTDGSPKFYSAEMNSAGQLVVKTLVTTSVLEYRHPLGILAELDAVGIAALERGDGGLAVQIRFQRNDIGYTYDYVDVFHLAHGHLRQLELIRLSSNYYSCTIEYFRLQKSDSGINTTPPMPVPPGERTGQVWFLTEDINRATDVVYLGG
ncbi:MAG: hypothetical protein P3T54_01945 [Dehalogenimonas sp.]|uniref:Lipocalin-like domain-containing protein n=1 Tax=Candidatus Dehalogenimonas loeffleri TaxID=3127115 RepID=A0ABZ2J599_9CHLR|nr:hypothetical protein [Dehalogenimonas sp.]